MSKKLDFFVRKAFLILFLVLPLFFSCSKGSEESYRESDVGIGKDLDSEVANRAKIFHSHEILINGESPRGTITTADLSADLNFYIPRDDCSVLEGIALKKYHQGDHWEEFNKLHKFWYSGNGYPYVGLSKTGRGSEASETSKVKFEGVYDLQMHPPHDGCGMVVSSFKVPADGSFSVINFGSRLTTNLGKSIHFSVYDSEGSKLQSLDINSQDWSFLDRAISLGEMKKGEKFYFSVENVDGYEWDAAEVSWSVIAEVTDKPQEEEVIGDDLPEGSVPGEEEVPKEKPSGPHYADQSRGEWSLVVIPDTQHYSQDRGNAPIENMRKAFDWIVSVKDRLNIQMVQGLGDITESWNSKKEWDNSVSAWNKLEGQVRYMPVLGNHDDPAAMNRYFPVSKFSSLPWWGGDFGGIENNYFNVTIGGEDYMFLHVEPYDQYSTYRPEGMAWAQRILSENPNKKVILATHDIWDTDHIKTKLLQKYDNIVMANSGHTCVREKMYVSKGPNGGVSHNFVTDYQCDKKEVMLIRYYVFKPLEDKVDYYTYSPVTDTFEKDAQSEGSFPLVQGEVDSTTPKPDDTISCRKPYRGSAARIPGTIEAEDYDIGCASDKTYYDSTPENVEGDYRKDAVDIGMGHNGGYSVTWIKDGEWLEYTVDVAKDATYQTSFLVSSESDVGTIKIYIDGEKKLSTQIQSTGDWTVWKRINGPKINLNAGKHIMRILIKENGFNLDSVAFVEENSNDSEKPIDDKEGWSLIWSDEFSKEGAPDPQFWEAKIDGNGGGNNELQYYSDRSKNMRVENGKLVLEAHKESMHGRKYTSGKLVTKINWLYGKIEVKAKLPRGTGTWPAIWMMPANSEYGGWPNSGEIDIMEHVGYDQDKVHSNIHTTSYNHMKNTNKGNSLMVSNASDEFHVYSVEWDADTLSFYVDDNPNPHFVFKNDHKGDSKTWPFNKKFYLILNIAVGGSWGGKHGVDDSIFSQKMEVDYVRVYKKN